MSDEEKQTKPSKLKRRLFLGGAGAVASGLILPAVAGCALSAPKFRGRPKGAIFRGGVFENLEPIPDHGFSAVRKWRKSRPKNDWGDFVDAPPGPKPEHKVEGGRVRATLVGHATVLLQFDGLNVLTDPIWSRRCSPVGWAGPKRFNPPGLRFEDLPPIDAVVISHNHYDHLDLPTLRRLCEKGADEKAPPKIFCPLGNAALLKKHGIEAVDMDWWETAALGSKASVSCVPAQHWSGRGTRDRRATLWCGFVIEAESGTIYYSGDTGAGPQFELVREKFGAPRLALLPIGAFRPQWFMGPVHMNPAEAVAAHQTLGATTSLAVHHATFRLADERRDEAATELKKARETAGLAETDFQTPNPGEAVDAAG